MTFQYRSDKGAKEAARARHKAAKAARKKQRRAEERHLGHVSDMDPTAGMEPIDTARVPADILGVARTLNRGGPLL
jgi:hypothetical protein